MSGLTSAVDSMKDSGQQYPDSVTIIFLSE